MPLAVLTLVVAGLLLSAGCDSRAGQTGTKTPGAGPQGTLPEGIALTEAPADAVDVVQAKSTAQAGDKVVVRGLIGGRRDPFVAERAIFQLVDTSLPTCKEKHGDGCPTPWDYCCEPKDQITAKSATVQLADAGGKPLAMGLNGKGGLEPMARIVVRGVVAEKPNDAVMIINADGIYVEQ
jgi:hypothetical protein